MEKLRKTYLDMILWFWICKMFLSLNRKKPSGMFFFYIKTPVVLYLSEGSLWYLFDKYNICLWKQMVLSYLNYFVLFPLLSAKTSFLLVPKVFFPPEVSFDMNTLLWICCMPVVCFPKLMSPCWYRHWKKINKIGK